MKPKKVKLGRPTKYPELAPLKKGDERAYTGKAENVRSAVSAFSRKTGRKFVTWRDVSGTIYVRRVK